MGGIINFVVRNNKLRFEINLGAGKRAGLMISSQLPEIGGFGGAVGCSHSETCPSSGS